MQWTENKMESDCNELFLLKGITAPVLFKLSKNNSKVNVFANLKQYNFKKFLWNALKYYDILFGFRWL